MAERRIMNRPGEKVGAPAPAAAPAAGAENISVKPKTMEERVQIIEEYAYGIDPVIRAILAEIGEIKNNIAILNEEITKIAGVQARSNSYIDGKFTEINNTFNALATVVKKVDDDYQTLFSEEEGVDPDDELLEPEAEPEPEPEYEAEEAPEEFMSTEPFEEYEEPEPEPEPEPVVKQLPKPAPRPVVKPEPKPVTRPTVQAVKQIDQSAIKQAPKPVSKPAPASMPKPPAPVVRVQQKKVASKASPLPPETEPRAPPTKSEESNAGTEEPKGFFGSIFKKKKENK